MDGGTLATAARLRERIEALPPEQRVFELLVVTHIDGDHIDGALSFLTSPPPEGLQILDIWFNGWKHLPQTLEPLGPVAGEKLTRWIRASGVAWNDAFNDGAVVVGDDSPLPEKRLPGGMCLTVLSPGVEQLARLQPVWQDEIRRAGLDPSVPKPAPPELPGRLEPLGLPDIAALARTPFHPDSAIANGSSIVLYAEFDDHCVLLGADAHATVLVPALERLADQLDVERVPLAAFKVSHHGSKANVSRELLECLDCPRYLFSTNGDHSHHPNEEAVARTIMYGGRSPTLYFNYAEDETRIWGSDALMRRYRYGYKAVYPPEDTGRLAVSLTDDR